MFRITFMCEDKKIAGALHALVNIAVEPPQIQPVANAVVKAGQVRNRVEGTNLATLIKNKLIGDNVTQITYFGLRTIVTELGYKPLSLNSALYQLYNKDKFLKRTGKGLYAVRH